LTDQKEMMEASVVSLTTEIESVRRTLVRAVDDVCTKYAHQSQPVSVFVRSRSSKSGRPVTSALGSPPRRYSPSTKPGKRGFGTTSTNSISAPQVDGVRGAVRDMSTLLHALASTSIAQHEAEQQELRSVQQRTSSVETELRRAHDLLSTARRQHEGTLQSTTSELSSERERNRQLDGVVRQLRDNANRTSATNSELKHRISELDNNLVKAESDLANLRVSLSTAQQEVSFSREECDQLRQALRDTQDQASQLKREVENGNMEMENLEETVSNELSSLSEQHQLEVDRSRNYKDELDQMSNVLRNCRLDLEEVRNNNRHLKTEMQTTNENHSLTMNEQVHRSENDIAQLNMTLNGLKNQMETDQLRQENTLEALRAELSSAEATAGMLREQNEQLMEEKREATSEANRASNALSGQEALSRAEHAQNEALQHRVENLENELSR
jgi:chromosome segregation ATPase